MLCCELRTVGKYFCFFLAVCTIGKLGAPDLTYMENDHAFHSYPEIDNISATIESTNISIYLHSLSKKENPGDLDYFDIRHRKRKEEGKTHY